MATSFFFVAILFYLIGFTQLPYQNIQLSFYTWHVEMQIMYICLLAMIAVILLPRLLRQIVVGIFFVWVINMVGLISSTLAQGLYGAVFLVVIIGNVFINYFYSSDDVR